MAVSLIRLLRLAMWTDQKMMEDIPAGAAVCRRGGRSPQFRIEEVAFQLKAAVSARARLS